MGNEHYNSSEDDEKKGDVESEEADTANYIKTDDNDIFGNMKDDEIGRQSEFEDGDSITPPSDSRSEIDSVNEDDMQAFIEKVLPTKEISSNKYDDDRDSDELVWDKT